MKVATNDPPAKLTSQIQRKPTNALDRNSNATPRRIRAQSISTSGRYNGKRAEQNRASDDQPGLVTVPDRRDRGQHLAPTGFIREGKQDAYTKVEAVEQHIKQDCQCKQSRPKKDHVALPCAITETGVLPATASGRFGLRGRT